ncbi:MAG: hypothetical protein KA180_01485 [Gemmatimonadales bacterium]|nr:hypothetical protein [Gemmatimonadales bacterium]MBP9199855.1 hypothetical protein [Gemmatimonadales bacterium]
MTFLYILAGIGLVGLAWRLAQLGQGARATPARTTGAPETVESLLAAGNTIGAIKRLREETGLGLAEAKAAIDARKGGLRLPTGTHPPAAPAGPSDPAAVAADPLLRDFLNAGNLIAAIRRYRELTGLGLKESKEAVERLGNGH